MPLARTIAAVIRLAWPGLPRQARHLVDVLHDIYLMRLTGVGLLELQTRLCRLPAACAGSPVKTISAFDATYGPTFQPLASALSSPAGSPFAAVASPMARAGSGFLPGASFTPVGSPLRHQSTLPPLPEESPPISYRCSSPICCCR